MWFHSNIVHLYPELLMRKGSSCDRQRATRRPVTPRKTRRAPFSDLLLIRSGDERKADAFFRSLRSGSSRLDPYPVRGLEGATGPPSGALKARPARRERKRRPSAENGAEREGGGETVARSSLVLNQRKQNQSGPPSASASEPAVSPPLTPRTVINWAWPSADKQSARAARRPNLGSLLIRWFNALLPAQRESWASLRENLDIKLSSEQVFLSRHYLQMMNLGIKGRTGSSSEHRRGCVNLKDRFYDSGFVFPRSPSWNAPQKCIMIWFDLIWFDLSSVGTERSWKRWGFFSESTRAASYLRKVAELMALS